MSPENSPDLLHLHYESLRADALARGLGPGRGLGRTLLLREGLPGWMQAWSKALLPAPRAAAQGPVPDWVKEVSQTDELVLLLAAMALKSCMEVSETGAR